MAEDFKCAAFQYLNYWFAFDRDFIADLELSNHRNDRLKCMQKIAATYRIARNFTRRGEQEADGRLGAALDALDEKSRELTTENAASVVENLSAMFKKKYGKAATSAASKFLWMARPGLVVIFDALAVHGLRHLDHGKRKPTYAQFHARWMDAYRSREALIRSACAELICVKDFSPARSLSDSEFNEAIEASWFHQRVFDKYLWGLGDGAKAEELDQVESSRS